MAKIAIIGKQQPLYIRKKMQEMLAESGHEADILDMPTRNVAEWIDNIKNSGIELLILSNSKKRRVGPFAEGLGLDFVSLGLKPLPFGFIRALKALKLKRSKVALAGDQIFTDVLGARLIGLKVFLLEPIKLEDGISFKIRRYFEARL